MWKFVLNRRVDLQALTLEQKKRRQRAASGNLSMQTDSYLIFYGSICIEPESLKHGNLVFAEREQKNTTGACPQVFRILTHKTTDEGVASVYRVAGSEAAGGARGSARIPKTASIARTEM